MAIDYDEQPRLRGTLGGVRQPVAVRVGATAAAQQVRFYSVPQAARMLGMSPVTLYRAIRAREFPAVQVRGRLIIPAKAIDAMIETAVDTGTLVDAAAWIPGGRA